MATEWKSQQSVGDYRLQFQTDDKEKFKFVEKAAQMAVDGKHTSDWLTRGISSEQLAKEKEEALADVVEVVRCRNCCWCMVTSQPYAGAYCIKGTRSFIVEADDFCSRGERKE